ncbi:ligase-associated DNA damage response endonuclease PdeM [Chryseolinea lacunae]|uniref:Ligase-associated DNA damage response endonuclease PdeM n=1 Tax=Chryseolinea lacunae TaxID=2801331 RepID=A0ABS1KK27_9BACT|nr:ligase-associated DNA damage response endonuclease PdeM [Chryseolinea lacunae]MBL0739699.1 ligase-associated DNA damage response endonuclease PdeM [Chryseolinea lacunae]
METEILGERLELWPQKAVSWPEREILLLADLHVGKINHFRRSGIPLPVKANDRNVEVLLELVEATKPKRIICLGDLFHSHYNPEWEVFGEVVKHFRHISFELVLGNHDIMSDIQYSRKGIQLHDELRIGPFIFTHHPLEEIEEGAYNLAGHIHPGVNLRGKGRQSVTLPCFYFGAQSGLLPAFGMFTGMARIYPRKNDKVFIILENKIMEVSTTS